MKNEWDSAGKIIHKVKTIRCLLMNSQWRVYLQKRSKLKSQNTGMYDKTVWWHVLAWQSRETTLTKECAEELGIPSSIINNDFEGGVSSIDLSIIGIFKQIDHIDNFESIRLVNEQYITYPQITKMYIWYYDWPLRFVDWEVSWIEVFSKDELLEELQSNPERFTKDLHYMFEKYHHLIKPIEKL